MYLLLSGEGKGDIGCCNNSQSECSSTDYQPGAMAHIVDKLVEAFIGYEYSHIEYGCVTYVSEKFIAENKLPPVRKAMALRGKKKPPETQYYYQNARSLAAKAKALSETIGDKVIAVLFRDADGTASAGRGHLLHKIESMERGFTEQDYFELGVPMIPMPKSEAWLLCALKDSPYQSCSNHILLFGSLVLIEKENPKIWVQDNQTWNELEFGENMAFWISSDPCNPIGYGAL